MTRVVAKSGQKDLVVTSSQPGVLYISSLPVEKNIFYGLQRKLKTIVKAFGVVYNHRSNVRIVNASCLNVDLPSGSVDYIFTDPPFGGNIPYSEVNFINEAWLGRVTTASEEITISQSQGKTSGDYGNLIARAFNELHRILKPNGRITAVFHSSSATIWNTFRKAYESAGFGIVHTNVLNKTQGSFKQVTTNGSVRGDPIMLLRKGVKNLSSSTTDIEGLMDKLISNAKQSKLDEENSPQRLYSRFIIYYLTNHQDIPIDADTFYKILKDRLERQY
jgi:DNA modification methylase